MGLVVIWRMMSKDQSKFSNDGTEYKGCPGFWPLLLVLARHKRTQNILMKLGHLQAYRSMPQNFAGWLVRCFRSRLPIRSMSSSASSKSKTLKFSSNLSSFDVFGMTTVFRWMPHRRTTWGTVLLYFSARPWSQRNKKTLFCKPALMVDLCKRSFTYFESWVIQTWYWTKPFCVRHRAAQRSVGSDTDSMLLTEFDEGIALEVGVCLDLIHSRLHFGVS